MTNLIVVSLRFRTSQSLCDFCSRSQRIVDRSHLQIHKLVGIRAILPLFIEWQDRYSVISRIPPVPPSNSVRQGVVFSGPEGSFGAFQLCVSSWKFESFKLKVSIILVIVISDFHPHDGMQPSWMEVVRIYRRLRETVTGGSGLETKYSRWVMRGKEGSRAVRSG